jgi:type I restriction enzyme S subunit
LKYVFRTIYRYPTYFDIEYVATGVPEVRGEALSEDGTIVELTDQRYISEETNARFPRTTLRLNDLVMSVRGTMGKIGVVGPTHVGANITANLIRLEPDPDLAESRYLSYLLRSWYFAAELDRISPQTTIKTITVPQLSSFTLPIPPLSTQRTITEFLDAATSRVAILVEKKDLLITLLEEKRAALINRAVTKGLDLSAPMKDSGIPWLGPVPARWTLAPIGSRYCVQLGKMLDSNRITGEHLAPYLRNVDVQWDRINTVELPEMDFPPDDQDRYRLRQGDLLVCEGGDVGRCATWDSPIPECFYQKALHRLRPLTQSEHPRFLYYCLRAAAGAGLFMAEGNPNTIDHLTAEKLKKHRLPFPSGAEQAEIACALDRETARIDTIITKTREQIAKFHEYRTALISAAVTGKIDVRARPAASAEIDKVSPIDEH